MGGKVMGLLGFWTVEDHQRGQHRAHVVYMEAWIG